MALIFAKSSLILYYYSETISNVMFRAICYHLYYLKNVKNAHGGVLLLQK